MPLQIRRGNTAEINAITPLVGEIIYNTQTGSLHVGNGTDPGGVIATAYSNDMAKDAAAESIADGTHSNISFTYNPTTKALSAALDAKISTDLKGSVYDATDTLLLDSATNMYYGNVDSVSGLSYFSAINIRSNVYSSVSSAFSVTQSHNTVDARNVSFLRSRGTYSFPTDVQTGDDLAELAMLGYAGGQYVVGGQITVKADDTAISSTSLRTKFQFFANGGAGVLREQISIEANGLLKANYGITNNTLTLDGNKISTIVSNADIELDPSGTGTVDFIVAEQTTVGSAGGATALPATPTKYFKIKVNGVAYVVPAYAVS
jgi:hypothetical protein